MAKSFSVAWVLYELSEWTREKNRVLGTGFTAEDLKAGYAALAAQHRPLNPDLVVQLNGIAHTKGMHVTDAIVASWTGYDERTDAEKLLGDFCAPYKAYNLGRQIERAVDFLGIERPDIDAMAQRMCRLSDFRIAHIQSGRPADEVDLYQRAFALSVRLRSEAMERCVEIVLALSVSDGTNYRDNLPPAGVTPEWVYELDEELGIAA